jgi:hypothetical protein
MKKNLRASAVASYQRIVQQFAEEKMERVYRKQYD